MKILFITTSYEQKANSAAIRNNGWVEGLIRNGADVDVLTIDWPDFMKSEFLIGHNRAKVIRFTLPELKALSVTRKTGGNKNPGVVNKIVERLRKYVRDMIFFPDVCKNLKNAIKGLDISEYDVIVSSSDFKSSHFAAHQLVKKTPKKWIQIWGDPWSSDINLSKSQKSRVLRNELKLLSAADQIIYVSDLTKKHLQKQYPELSGKMHYIPRGYYLTAGSERKKHEDYVYLTYTGVLSIGRNIGQLIDAISRYNTNHIKQIRLKLYGNYNSEQIEQLALHNWIEVNNSVDYGEVLDIYSKSDLLLFISNGNNSTQIPGKFFDYAGSDKPIVCICSREESGLYQMLSEYDRCVLPASYSDSSFDSLLIESVEKTRSVFLPVEEFSPEAIGKQLLRIIKGC